MKPAPSLLTLAILAGLSPLAHADAAPDARTLDTVKVEAAREKNTRSANQNVQVLGRAELDAEMAESMEDLVRYIPGVSVVDMGRFGDNGFNIRGMEGDRISMTIDGLGMAEGLETARSYEFFRAGRGGVDIDTLKQVEVIKGADSITSGSGSLGGGVAFTTKDPADYLKASGNDSFGSLKLGYTGHNDEKLGSFTVANRSGIVESMLVYTKRKSHESEGWYDSTAVETGSARRLPDPIDHDSNNVLAKVDFVLDPAHRLGVVYERNRVDNLVENLSRVSVPGYLERWGDDSNSRDRYGLRYVWNAGNTLFDTLEAQADRQQTDSRGITRVTTGSGSSANPAATPRTTPCTLALNCQRAEDRSTEQVLDRLALDLDKRAGTHALVYGASWQNREIDFSAIDYRWNNAGELDTATVDPGQVPRTDARSWNVYLRDRINLLDDALQLNLGARYDRHDYTPHLGPTFQDKTGTVGKVRFASPTWQAGISYLFAPGNTVWFQAGRGFRAPTTGEMYAPTSTTSITEVATGAVVVVPTSAANPDLESEKSLNLELGWRWQGERSRLALSAFRDRYSDYIESVRMLNNPGTQYRTCATCAPVNGYNTTVLRNTGEVTVKGFEGEGLWRLGDAWLLRAAYSHNEGELKNGKPLASINPDRGVLGLSWQGLDQRLRLTGALTHALAKKRKDAALATDITGQASEPFLSDAYTVFDLFGSYRFNDHLKINAGVYNLFDERYYQWARIRDVSRGDFYLYGYATEDGIGRYSEPGRNYRVNLTWTF
ncbi:MAG: TonB-dependent hemoglobin/transferrin/lactoferrin family receptor [Stenotrophomonas sp.]